MASLCAILIVILVNFLLRLTIFIQQPLCDQCTPLSTFSSWMNAISTVLILLDINLLPCQYKIIPKPFQLFAETILCILLTEFSTIFIWCKLENTFYTCMKLILMDKYSNMYFDMGGDNLVGFLINLGSILILWNVSQATGAITYIRYNNNTLHILNNIKEYCFNIKWCKINNDNNNGIIEEISEQLHVQKSDDIYEENNDIDCHTSYHKFRNPKSSRNGFSGIPKIKKSII